MIPSENDIQNAINAQCSCGGGCPDTGCIWCQIYHVVMALRAIRSGFNMEAEGATASEVVAEAQNIHNDRMRTASALCGQVNGLRNRITEADRLLQNEFGEFYESAQLDEFIGRVRDILRNNDE